MIFFKKFYYVINVFELLGEDKKQKKFAQPIKKRHMAALDKKKLVSTVEILQRVLMPPRLTQFITHSLQRFQLFETDFQHDLYCG